jgi:hypothetical protein
METELDADGNPLPRRAEVHATRMRLPTAGTPPSISQQRMRQPSSSPSHGSSSEPVTEEEDSEQREAARQFNERSATTQQVARAFVDYCYWRTLCPLALVNQAKPPAVRLLHEKEAEPQGRNLFAVTTTEDAEPAELESDETRRHVTWRQFEAGALVTEAEWFHWSKRMPVPLKRGPTDTEYEDRTLRDVIAKSPARQWFEAIAALVEDAYAFCSKPPTQRKFNLIEVPQHGLSEEDLPLENMRRRAVFREFFKDLDAAAMRSASVPYLFRVQEWGRLKQPADVAEGVEEQMASTRWIPGPDPHQETPPALTLVVGDNDILFRVWFPVIVPEEFSATRDPDAVTPTKPVEEFWRCFLNPLICGFVEEYMLD